MEEFQAEKTLFHYYVLTHLSTPHYNEGKCCQWTMFICYYPLWNGEESRKSPHPYWPWLSINKSWSIAHEVRLWQRSTHWAEFTEINISLPNTYLPCATIYNLCHSCSTFWHSLNRSEPTRRVAVSPWVNYTAVDDRTLKKHTQHCDQSLNSKVTLNTNGVTHEKQNKAPQMSAKQV